MHDQIREEELMEDIHYGELITSLRSIIAEQESRILQLEQDLKKWEKKYKEEFFKDSRNVRSKSTVEKTKSSEHALLIFTK
jgi:predicted GIY-YIG superfamily endonuclease